MVAPITGPFTKVIEDRQTPPGVSWTYIKRLKSQTWYRQTKPYNLPLQYDMSDRKCAWHNDARGGVHYGAYTGSPAFRTGSYQLAYNRAYAKFVDHINEQSQWANNLLERSQSFDMIRDRAIQLARFTRQLRRGHPLSALHELKRPGNLRPPKTKRKGLADQWLEFVFGWKPLVSDIGASVETLCSDLPVGRIRGKGIHADGFVLDPRSYTPKLPGGSVNVEGHHWSTKVMIRAKVRVTNPNTFLLSQLGFVNPASIVWESIPFSFVVDWFTNVGQVLASWTDFTGIELLDPHVSSLQMAGVRHQYYYWGTDPKTVGGNFIDAYWESVYAKRQLGISNPKLVWKGFNDSPARAVTAISLLVQQLAKIR